MALTVKTLKRANEGKPMAKIKLKQELNELQENTIQRIHDLTKHGYKTIDIKIRKDGVERWFEGDFLAGMELDK